MIDPDINEQMARFAPSQNPADPGFDAIEKAVAGMSGVPMPKADPVDIDIDRAVQDIAAQRRQDMASSLMAASEVNPDEAAQADALGRRFGVGQDIALRNMAEMRRQAMIQDTERMDLLRRDPVLARYIADREFAAQASDDVGVLSLLRPLVLEAAVLQTPGGFFRVVGAGYERGQVVSERGDIGAKAMAGFAEQGDFDRAKELSTRMQQLGQQGLFGSAAEMIAQNVSQLRTIGTTAAGGAAIGSLAGPAGTVAGGALGAAAGVVIGTGTMEAGNLYLDMREQGVSDDSAIPVAIAGGFLNGVIEVVGMKIASKPFKALASKIIREEVSKAVAQPTMRSALRAAGKAYGLQVGGEASEEGLQEIVAIASEEIAKAADGIDSETSLREATGRVIEAFAYGGMATALLGGIGPGANLVVDLRRASATQRQQAFFDGLVENRKESKLAQRNPQGYERFLAAQAKDTPAETIYVDGRIAQQVLAQSGVPTAQLEEILPGIRERISEAVQTGGDVTIPTARFGARLANTELGNALLPHMRLSPDAMSATEAQEFATRRQDVVREAEQILAQKQEADATFVQQARQIEDTLASQIVATGQMDEKAARSSAQFMRDFYVTQAAALGMSPQQVYERFPVRVEGAMPAAVAPLEQTARETFPDFIAAWDKYNDQTDEWQTTNDLADELEALLEDGRAPAELEDALQKFREEQEFDIEVAGRGEMDTANEQLESAVETIAEKLRVSARLEQADQFDQAGQRRTDTPEFKAWSNDAPVIANEQSEAHEFTTGTPVVVEALHGSTERGLRRFDVGRAVEVPGAIFFTSNPAVAEQYTYERAYGEIISEQPTGDVIRAYVAFANPMVYQPKGKVVDAIEMGRAIEQAKAAGHDGLIIKNIDDSIGMTGDMGDVYVTWNPTSIKSVNNRGTWSRTTANIMEQAATMDAEYMAAVERGDMATAQRMVDEAARSVGLTELVWRGDRAGAAITQYRRGARREPGIFTTTTQEIADKYAGGVGLARQFYVGGRTLDLTTPTAETVQWIRQWAADAEWDFVDRTTGEQIAPEDAVMSGLLFDWEGTMSGARWKDIQATAAEQGYDIVKLIDMDEQPFVSTVVLNENRIKSADAITYDEAGNIVPLSRRFDITSPRIFEQAAVPSQIDAQHREAIKAGDIATAQELTDAAAGKRMPASQVRDADGKIMRVFHGTQRIDRVGNRLLKKRATSGPMPFFTNTRPIAEGYAQGKQDTSIEDIGYEQWVKYTPKGQRSKVTLDQAWFYLTPEQKATATERIFTTGYENPDEGTGAIVGNTDTIASRDHVAYLLREARGNALTAAKELWLNSGSLFNEEQQFMDVLKGMGLTERFVYDSPHAVNSGIIEAYLNITNPLDTAAIPALVVEALQRRADRSRRPAAQYGRDIWDKETRNPQEWMATLRSDIAEGKTQAWTSIPDWVTDVLRGLGYDGIKDMGGKFGGEQHTVWIPFEPEQVKFADAIAKDASGRLIPLSERFDLTSPMMYRQEGILAQDAAAPGPRGGFDPKRLTTILNKTADLSTFLHESAHAFLTFYEQVASTPDAPARIVNDMDELLRWFKIDGTTPAERIANWNGLTLDQKRKYHETFAYNFEVYLFDGKAPSTEMQGLFERFSAWLKRVYRSIRDDLNAIYRREFGEDLPILTGEVRQVMDRMLATDEQIKRQAAINEMKPQFQTQEQSGMDDAEWAAYQAMQQEAIEASITDMNKASMRQLQWLGNARSRILRDMQRKHDAKRKEVAAEMAAELRVEPVYRAMTYLRTGKFIDADGAEVEMEGPHRLDIKQVKAIYAGMPSEADVEPIRATGMAVPVTRPQFERLGYGKYGMLAEDGVAPDLVAETFGYSSGDQMIRALLEAKPIKEAVAERTDAEMLRRFGDMNTPEAREAEVQKALHNEARARFVAVELRHIARATEPVRVMVEAAKQVARELIAGTTVRDVRPADFIAAEARAARDASRMGTTINPAAVGQAAQTRAYNEAIEAGTDPAEAMAAAIEKGAEAARKAQERSDALKAQYGADPQQALIRAKRAQLYQNQLAAEALRVREEVAKQVKYLRRILRDTNVKAMGAQAADQIAGLLERFEVAPVSLKRLDERKALATWLAEQEAAGLVPDIAPEVADEARRVNYQQLTVAEFRDLVDAIRQIEFIGKNERKVQLAAERAAFEEKRDEIVTRIRAVGRLRGVKFDPRSPLTNIGRAAAALRGFAAQHLKAASVARILDGGEDDGPLWTFVIRSANAAADMETRMRAEASAKMAEILAPVFVLGNMGGKGVFFPSINRSLNRESRIAIAMNVGNDGNRQRLLDGEGWTMEQVQPVLESLTEAEWKAVQQVWDYIDTYRPLIAEKERRLYGKEPEWVKPTPFTTRTADGREVRLEGGYYPIKYDPIASDRVATVDEAAEAKRALDGAYTAATTRRSFVKSRVREVVGRPLLYTLDAAFGGVNDVIHDLSWHEWLIQTQRLLRDPEFANAVRETRGPEYLKQLRDWTKDNAAGERKIGVAGEAALSWLRQGISASGLGFNVVSAAMQVTGFNQSIVRLGAGYVGRGVAQFAASPIDTARMVADKSSFMAERGRTQFREINEIRNRVRGQTEVARRVTSGTYFLMMNMQRTVDIPTWLAGYQKALDAGKDDATAVALADQAVRDTQGSGLISDLAAIERGGPVMKLFTVFYSYMNTVYNMTAVQTMTARSKGKLAADYAMLLVVPVVLGQAIKNLIQPDAGDDELDPEALARKLAAEELSFLMGTMVIAREFGGAAQLLTGAEGVRMGYGGPAGLRAVGEVYGLATQAGQLEFDRAFRRSAINTLGAFTGLPSAQINRTIDGIEALVEGEVEGPTAVLAPLTGVQR